jgi:hypothetical protein
MPLREMTLLRLYGSDDWALHRHENGGEILPLAWDKIALIRGKIVFKAGATRENGARIASLSGELYQIILNQEPTGTGIALNTPLCSLEMV